MWRMCDYGEDHIFWGHCKGGNGGLSLRSRSKMLDLIERYPRSTTNEDYQFALWFAKDNSNSAPLEVNREVFSEELRPKVRDTPIGIHKIWAYQSPPAVQDLLRRCQAPLRFPGEQTEQQAKKAPSHTHDEL